jgi:ABC-2 type transport system permease protein
MALQVARWEFTRFFKIRDVITTIILFVLFGGAVVGVKKLLAMNDEEIRVAVLHGEILPFRIPDDSSVILESASPGDEASLREAVANDALDGLLILESADRATLLVGEEPPWQEELVAALSAARRNTRIAESGLTSDQLAEVLAPFRIELEYDEPSSEGAGRRNLIGAGAVLGLMLLGIFLGSAYLFTAITGEKTQRVSEQIIAAIPIQTWVDGKILGQSLLAFSSMGTVLLGYLITNFLVKLVGDGIDIPLTFGDPALLALFILLALLGFFFWFAFFAAVAATIDDPNSSTRSSFLLLPVLTLAVGFAALKSPDNPVVRVLSLLPITSPTTLSARLAVAEVAAWEVVVAILLLLAGIWIARRAAGKIFELSILMYGVEPTWGEMFRQLRR